MGWQAGLKHVKESKRELWHLTKNIQYEGFKNIRYGESSAYFSFHEKTYQCFQSLKKNISCLRMFGNDVHLFWAAFAHFCHVLHDCFSPRPIPIYSMKAAHLLSLHVEGAIADVFVPWFIYIYILYVYIYISYMCVYIYTACLFLKVANDKNGKEISSKPVGVWHVMESHSTCYCGDTNPRADWMFERFRHERFRQEFHSAQSSNPVSQHITTTWVSFNIVQAWW